jgi:hypothetical protein
MVGTHDRQIKIIAATDQSYKNFYGVIKNIARHFALAKYS